MLGLAAWRRPPEPMPGLGTWVSPAILIASGAVVATEADVLVYGLLCGVFAPAVLLFDWWRFRSVLHGDGKAAVDRLFWTTALALGWFAMLLSHEGS
jgi:hypothetical protein